MYSSYIESRHKWLSLPLWLRGCREQELEELRGLRLRPCRILPLDMARRPPRHKFLILLLAQIFRGVLQDAPKLCAVVLLLHFLLSFLVVLLQALAHSGKRDRITTLAHHNSDKYSEDHMTAATPHRVIASQAVGLAVDFCNTKGSQSVAV